MKRLSPVICIAVAMFLWVPAALGDTVQVGYAGSSYGLWQTGSGGEFSLTPQFGSSLDGVASHYASATSNIGVAGSFQSFCLEFNEYIYGYPTKYNYVVSDSAVSGGLSGGNPDPVSIGTAWLYSQFAAGLLSGYQYVGDRTSSAAALQNAIWYLEGEGGALNAGYTTLLTGQFGSVASARDTAANGAYGVKVLNLTTQSGAPAQDQLVMVPVPEPDAWLLLGALLVGLVARVVPRRSS